MLLLTTRPLWRPKWSTRTRLKPGRPSGGHLRAQYRIWKRSTSLLIGITSAIAFSSGQERQRGGQYDGLRTAITLTKRRRSLLSRLRELAQNVRKNGAKRDVCDQEQCRILFLVRTASNEELSDTWLRRTVAEAADMSMG